MMKLQNNDTKLVLELSTKPERQAHGLSKLQALSESKEATLQYNGNVILTFAGHDDDPRELFEIPEVIDCVAQLTKQWPYWLHFLSRELIPGNTVPLYTLLVMLAPPSKVVKSPQSMSVQLDYQTLKPVILDLNVAMLRLHHTHAIDPGVTQATKHEVAQAIGRMLNL